jgi:uncharacterized membrane protein
MYSDTEIKILVVFTYVYIALSTMLAIWHLSVGDIQSVIGTVVTMVMVIVLVIAFIHRDGDVYED